MTKQQPPQHRIPCPAGAGHRLPKHAALTPLQRWQMRAFAKEGKTTRWLSSHYGIPPERIRSVLRGNWRLRHQRKPLPPPRRESAAVAL